MRSLGEALAPFFPLSFMLAGGVTSPGQWEWPAHASFVAAALVVSLGVVALAVWEFRRGPARSLGPRRYERLAG